MLEDETKTGFKLVIDGYLQNEQSVKKVNLQKLEAGTHDLIFLMDDGADLHRKINLKESAYYQYVLHRNFKGERKLRFRGSYAKLSQNALVLDFNRNNEYEDHSKAIVAIDSLPHYTALPDPETIHEKPEVLLAEDSNKTKPSALASAGTDSGLEQKPSTFDILTQQDSTSEKNPVKNPSTERDINTSAFSALQNSIQLNSFEFDKIQMIEEFLAAEKISASQFETLLKELKYDQSRLQILKTALSKQSELKTDKALFLATLDYELSRQKAETFFQ
tara:strand:- start:2093 stop:2920 length:828 start_codon:yes stop_codon:yes gene_type:complete